MFGTVAGRLGLVNGAGLEESKRGGKGMSLTRSPSEMAGMASSPLGGLSPIVLAGGAGNGKWATDFLGFGVGVTFAGSFSPESLSESNAGSKGGCGWLGAVPPVEGIAWFGAFVDVIKLSKDASCAKGSVKPRYQSAPPTPMAKKSATVEATSASRDMAATPPNEDSERAEGSRAYAEKKDVRSVMRITATAADIAGIPFPYRLIT